MASIVLLDVNPSIELRVDDDADVIEAVALNDDAAKVLEGMKLKGADADTAVNAIIGALLKHGYVDGKNVGEMADEYDISKGKAELIQSILSVNNTYEAKDLAKLSVNELSLILSNPKNEVNDVVSTGTASDSAYIGRDKAKEAAFAHAGVAAESVRDLEVDFDYEYGKMVYEIDFASGEYEYDYCIDAENGEVLYSHRELEDD